MISKLARILALALAVSAPAFALQPSVGALGRAAGSVGVGTPLSLPQLQTSQLSSTFTFLGSFTAAIGGGALSVCDAPTCGASPVLYTTGNFYDPYNSSRYIADGAIGAQTIPTLTGTPVYNGGNGSASTVYTPIGPGSIVSPTTACPSGCTVTGAPTTGATSATLSGTLPTGFAANAGWYVKFSDNEEVLVTGLTGNTFSWSGGLTGGSLTTSVTIHQWNPSKPWGSASGYVISGSLVYNGTLYLAGGTWYDSNCNANLGWILPANLDLTSESSANFGSVNTASGYTINPGSLTAAEYSRRYAGSLIPVPSAWQSIVGAPAAEGGGPGLSIVSCGVPQGFSFNAFDPANVSQSGGSVPITPELDYFYSTPAGASMNHRFSSGPFPTTGYPAGLTSYGTYTLTSAPVAGATSFTLSTPFPDNNGVTGFDNSTSTATTGTTSSQIVASAPTGGWPQNWSANYWVGGFLFDITHQGACRISSSTAETAGSTGTFTATCISGGDTITGMASGDDYVLSLVNEGTGCWCKVTFSDGEVRIINLTTNSTASGSTFVTMTGCQSGTCTNSALTCSPSCTTSVTIAPLGDNYISTYDGPMGTEFILPGSSTLVVLSLHQYGPGAGRPGSGECGSGASGSNDLPQPPDTQPYIRPQLSLYSMQDIDNQKNGTYPIYNANPYAFAEFPDASSWNSGGGSCFHVGGSGANAVPGWAYYDPATGILYASVVYETSPSWINVIDEWRVNPL